MARFACGQDPPTRLRRDRLTVSGDANSIIRTVISRIGLSTVFDVPSEASGINISNYSFRRYITAWDGLRMMLTAQGARLDLTYTAGRCRIRAVAADTYGDADSDQRISFEAQRIWTQVNHLTGLGKGQLRNRRAATGMRMRPATSPRPRL